MTIDYDNYGDYDDYGDYGDEETPKCFLLPTLCGFCNGEMPPNEANYFGGFQEELWVHKGCLKGTKQRDDELQRKWYADLDQWGREESAHWQQKEEQEQRELNSSINRLGRFGWVLWQLLRVGYWTTDRDLELLAHCLLGQHLDYYGVPLWLAPTWMSAYQRSLMISEADWAAEGALSREELTRMGDKELAQDYLGAISGYARSQGF